MEPCCQVPTNLYRRENDPEERPDLMIWRCYVCSRRHFKLMVEPGVLGIRGESI